MFISLSPHSIFILCVDENYCLSTEKVASSMKQELRELAGSFIPASMLKKFSINPHDLIVSFFDS